jgi:hypothetical protein
MPGIYGPPTRRKPTSPGSPAAASPVPPARPESTAIKALRWAGTIAIFIAAMYLWVRLELQNSHSEESQRLIELQRTIDRINTSPRFDFDVKLPAYEPLQTADIIPSSAFIKPGEAPPPSETATLITPR